MVEEGKGSLAESVCTSGVDSHHRLAEGRELSGEGDSMAGTQGRDGRAGPSQGETNKFT